MAQPFDPFGSRAPDARNGGIPCGLATSSAITNACQRAGQWQQATALTIANLHEFATVHVLIWT